VVTRYVALWPALAGGRSSFDTAAGRVSYYHSPASGGGTTTLPPLVLIHSVNAAASAAEVRPIYEHYAGTRDVYALDLPGFGFSERSERLYTPRLMTDAVHALVSLVRQRHGGVTVDALAVSLGCEFLARAAQEQPGDYRCLTLVSPTGLRGTTPRTGAAGTVIGSPRIHRALVWRGVGAWLFGQLTRPSVIAYFLRRTWGSERIDTKLLDYDCATARQPGAEHAPLCFLSALLFSADAVSLYDSLKMPVWMVHGVRGDFTDYRQSQRYATAGNWSISVMQTGALPYFEEPAAFLALHERFLASV
jgi:pimeloyl-ACP methyl ester carboxylesterase